MHFPFPATYCSVMNGTIRDSHSLIRMRHRMSDQDETTMTTKTESIPSPLFMHTVHVFDTVNHKTTLVANQPCPLIITYKSGVDRIDRHI